MNWSKYIVIITPEKVIHEIECLQVYSHNFIFFIVIKKMSQFDQHMPTSQSDVQKPPTQCDVQNPTL